MSLVSAYLDRCEDGEAYLEAAWRVDPQPQPTRYLAVGLVAFCAGRLGDAIVSLNKADPRGLNENGKRQRLFLLAAAYAHLSQADGVASVKAELGALTNISGMRAASDLPFKKGPALERGLTKAGLPDFPLGYRWNSSDRLTGSEIGSLVFGRELRGRQSKTGDPYRRTTTVDGAAKVTFGSSINIGTSRLEGDFLCTAWDADLGLTCAAIFRNPDGSHEMQNEYILLNTEEGFEFSVVK